MVCVVMVKYHCELQITLEYFIRKEWPSVVPEVNLGLLQSLHSHLSFTFWIYL